MDRFKQIDASTSSIGAVLFHNEEVVSLQEGIGLYDGKDKTLNQSSGTVYLTSHRLLYIDDAQPHRHSCSLELSLVKQTEFYAGFLKSSPKITLTLAPSDPSDLTANDRSSKDWRVTALPTETAAPSKANWVCAICGFSNAGSASLCELCGVTKEPTRTPNGNAVKPSPAPSSDDRSSSPKPSTTCSACTFHNHPSMSSCEMCGASLGRHFPEARASSVSAPMTPTRKSLDAASAAPTRSSTPGISTNSVKLSFRKAGDKPFYNLLKSTLRSKAWTASTSTTTSGNTGRRDVNTPDLDGRAAAVRRVGIDGIMSSVDSAAKLQSDDMQGALKDLEALMARAKQMVDFAEALNTKLTKQEQAAAAARVTGDPDAPAQPDSEAATLIRSSLVQLGLSAPAVTADMVRDQQEYHRELARELAGLLLGLNGMMEAGGKGKARGIVALDEVWCVWNRVRGVALVPPAALRSAAIYLPAITTPSVRIKTFKSGLSVLHTPQYSDDAFAARILHLLDTLEWEHKVKRIELGQRNESENTSPWGSGASVLEIAEQENVPILLINEMMEMLESTTAMVVRDEGGSNGTRWFVNHFPRV